MTCWLPGTSTKPSRTSLTRPSRITIVLGPRAGRPGRSSSRPACTTTMCWARLRLALRDRGRGRGIGGLPASVATTASAGRNDERRGTRQCACGKVGVSTVGGLTVYCRDPLIVHARHHAHLESGPRAAVDARPGRCAGLPRQADAATRRRRRRLSGPRQPTASRPPRVELTAGVAAANPYAVEAGLAVLRAGGGAADAAVAVQAALGLVEPQSSGLGGGAFLLYYDAQTGKITAFDGRETAPAGATPGHVPRRRGQAALVPGRGDQRPLDRRAGRASRCWAWRRRSSGACRGKTCSATAERLAADGFVVPQRLGRFANSTFAQATLPDARALFTHPDGTTDQGRRHAAQPGLRRRRCARSPPSGPRALLEGPLAAEIVERTRAEPRPGTLTLGGPRRVPSRSRPSRCASRIASTSSACRRRPRAASALLQLLGLLERTDIAARGPDDPQAWFLFAEASRLMYADRDQLRGRPALHRGPGRRPARCALPRRARAPDRRARRDDGTARGGYAAGRAADAQAGPTRRSTCRAPVISSSSTTKATWSR